MQISKTQVGKKLNVIFYQGFCFMSPAGRDQHSAANKARRVTQASKKAGYSALERAGIEGFRWHDRRH